MYLHKYISPIGTLHLASDGTALTGLWLEGQKYFPQNLNGTDAFSPVFKQAQLWLDSYFLGASLPSLPSLPPLAPQGTAFRQAVWKLLLEIPYGKTATYGQLSQALWKQGIKSSPQAVGGAVGHNPISILIPCHRCVGADGSLTGYAGGLAAKDYLLRLEGALPNLEHK